jgi:hypothetical protein
MLRSNDRPACYRFVMAEEGAKDVTVEILREIRDEIVKTRTDLRAEIAQTRTELTAGVAATNERIDLTNVRLDVVVQVLGSTNQRLVSVEDTVREIAGTQLMLSRYVANRANRHDVAIEDLRERVEKLEEKAGM